MVVGGSWRGAHTCRGVLAANAGTNSAGPGGTGTAAGTDADSGRWRVGGANICVGACACL